MNANWLIGNWGWARGLPTKQKKALQVQRAYILGELKNGQRWVFRDTYAIFPKVRREMPAFSAFPIYFMIDVYGLVSYNLEWFLVVVELYDGTKIVSTARRIVRDKKKFKILAEKIEL